jgi:hypothetical protein
VLFRDNVRPHAAPRTRALLERFSPDLAPSDYRLSTYLKILKSQRFKNNEELMKGVKT